MGDDPDARDEFDSGDELLLPHIVEFVSLRLVERVQGARCQSFVGLEQISPVGRGGHDENRCWAVGHDEFRGRQAVHHGHHHVQGDDIGSQLLAQFDSALAVVRFANDVDLRIGREHLQHAFADCEGILNHQDTYLRHA